MFEDVIVEGLFGERGDRVRVREWRCPVPHCRQVGHGEQAPRCPDHPYREMEN